MKTVKVKPAGKLPVPLPAPMRKPGRGAIPMEGATVELTYFIQRRLDAGDLVVVTDAPAAKPVPANDASPAKPATKES